MAPAKDRNGARRRVPATRAERPASDSKAVRGCRWLTRGLLRQALSRTAAANNRNVILQYFGAEPAQMRELYKTPNNERLWLRGFVTPNGCITQPHRISSIGITCDMAIHLRQRGANSGIAGGVNAPVAPPGRSTLRFRDCESMIVRRSPCPVLSRICQPRRDEGQISAKLKRVG